jgi:uncharacterized protein
MARRAAGLPTLTPPLALVITGIHLAPVALAAPPQVLPLSAEWCLAELPSQHPDCIALEVAATTQQQAWGLQQRPRLAPRRGMWFPFATPTATRFWMHLTPEPLDILFVRDGRVHHLVQAAPPCPRLPCPSYASQGAVDGVVELAAGQAKALGIGIGTAVTIRALPRPIPQSLPLPQP